MHDLLQRLDRAWHVCRAEVDVVGEGEAVGEEVEPVLVVGGC